MIRMVLVFISVILGNSASFKYASDQVCYRGELTDIAKVLIDSFLKEEDCRYLSSEASVIILNFGSNIDDKVLTINDESIEQFKDISNTLNTDFKGFKIIIRGIPDDFIFRTKIDKRRLEKELKKKQDAIRKMYDKIEKGTYNKDVEVYSEYDPQMYYYIYYSGQKITKTVPEYLLEDMKQ